MPDDSLMTRFDQPALRSRARDGLLVVFAAALLLVLFRGDAIRRSGEEMDPGIGRDIVLAVGNPAAWLSPGGNDSSGGGFTATTGGGAAITADAFELQPAPRKPLKTLLVTGDSLSTPLDTDVARLLSGRGVKVIRDPHLGTGISKPFVVDWGALSKQQVGKDRPDAVVVFIGANEGFPLPRGKQQIKCCGADWAAIYAGRVRAMTDTYRRAGAARVYWITVPVPRDKARQAISRTVNAALEVAVQPWRSQVRIIDTVPTFTPHDYRDAMPVGGRDTIVRRPDGIHLNDAGANLLAKIVLERVNRDFVVPR